MLAPPLGYRLRLNRVYKTLETRLFVQADGGPRLEEDLREGRLSKGPETVAPRRSVSGARPRERAPSPALLHQRRVVGLVKDNI